MEWYITEGRHSELDYWTAETVAKGGIPARLILAKIVVDQARPYPDQIVVNNTSEYFGIPIDAVTVLEKIEHDKSRRGGYEDFKTVENAIAYFQSYGSQVEVRENFDDVVASLTSGLIGLSEEDTKE